MESQLLPLAGLALLGLAWATHATWLASRLGVVERRNAHLEGWLRLIARKVNVSEPGVLPAPLTERPDYKTVIRGPWEYEDDEVEAGKGAGA